MDGWMMDGWIAVLILAGIFYLVLVIILRQKY